jgi:hypothetical protein
MDFFAAPDSGSTFPLPGINLAQGEGGLSTAGFSLPHFEGFFFSAAGFPTPNIRPQSPVFFGGGSGSAT